MTRWNSRKVVVEDAGTRHESGPLDRLRRFCCLVVPALLCSLNCGLNATSEDLSEKSSALYVNQGNCPPFDDNSVCMCTGGTYSESCYIYSAARHMFPEPNHPGTDIYFPDDKMSSGITGALVGWVFLYQTIHFGEGLNTPQGFMGSSGTPGILTFYPDFGANGVQNDRLSSFKIETKSFAPNSIPPGYVALYENINYNSPAGGDVVVLGVGNYPNDWSIPNANGVGGSFGLHNDTVSSLKLGSGVTVTIYSDPNFGGASFQFVLSGGSPDLRFNNWNDKVSSVRVVASQ